ncbi:MAG: S24 family peptidase [Beijerinckiaceae bacterium]|nr:S24 family peptidase [Beijerinckiaceae bacterium]
MANPDQPYIDWIKAALARKVSPDGRRLTQTGISKAIGIDHAQVSRMLDGKRRLKHWEIAKIAAYLGEPVPNLVGAPQAASETGHLPLAENRSKVISVPVRGECAGGRWMEYDLGDSTYDDVPVVPTRFGGLEQFAYRVHGASMDKVKILDGDYVVCVPYFDARARLTDGDVVVVERRRGGLYERTCKSLELRAGGIAALVSQSNDPRHADPLLELPLNGEFDEGLEIEVVGLVVGRYSAF